MVIKDDGDIIRGLGFVTLYSGYLEEAIEDCFDVVVGFRPPAASTKIYETWPASAKARYCRSEIAEFVGVNHDMRSLTEALNYALHLLERRHEVIHGRIYGGLGGPDVQRSDRKGKPDREITSGELYNLANNLFNAHHALMADALFTLDHAFRKHAEEAEDSTALPRRT
jgi:hypothetical protein